MSQVSPDSSRIADALRDPLSDLGLDLEAVELTPAGKRRVLRIAVDKDGGVTLDDIADATRAVSGVLDDSDADGRDGLHPRGHLARRRPSAHRAPPLAPQPRPPRQGLAPRRHPAHRPRHRRATTRGVTLDVDGTPRRLAYDEVAKALVQIEFNRPTDRGGLMDIDLSVLRMLEREKEISFDVLVEAIEQALLTAYHKTPGARGAGARRARPQQRPRHRVRRRARRRGHQDRGVRRHPRRLRPDRRDDGEADHAAAAARRRGRHPLRRVLRQGGRPDLRGHPAGPQPRRRDGRPRQARGAAARWASGCPARPTRTASGSSAW